MMMQFSGLLPKELPAAFSFRFFRLRTRSCKCRSIVQRPSLPRPSGGESGRGSLAALSKSRGFSGVKQTRRLKQVDLRKGGYRHSGFAGTASSLLMRSTSPLPVLVRHARGFVKKNLLDVQFIVRTDNLLTTEAGGSQLWMPIPGHRNSRLFPQSRLVIRKEEP